MCHFLVTCWAFSNCIQNAENSLFRYKLALFNYYKCTILERQQWFRSYFIAQEKSWRKGVCTQANFWLLHITLRGETKKSQRWELYGIWIKSILLLSNFYAVEPPLYSKKQNHFTIQSTIVIIYRKRPPNLGMWVCRLLSSVKNLHIMRLVSRKSKDFL